MITSGDKRRLIACIGGAYQLLVPERRDEEGRIVWSDSGEVKTIEQIHSIVNSGRNGSKAEYVVSGVCSKTEDALRQYERQLAESREEVRTETR